MLSHQAELLAFRRGTCKGVMGLAALLLLNTCSGVAGDWQGLAGGVIATGLPWPGASFATAPCIGTAHHEIIVPLDACDVSRKLGCTQLCLCRRSQEGYGNSCPPSALHPVGTYIYVP